MNSLTINYTAKLDAEWANIREKAISKLEQYLTTGDKEVIFSKKEYMQIYTSVYDLCITQVEFICAELYKRYTESIRDYLITDVLKKLNLLTNDSLLVELDLRWSNH